MTTFVCAGRHVYAFADEASAMDAALDLARTHQRVGVANGGAEQHGGHGRSVVAAAQPAADRQ